MSLPSNAKSDARQAPGVAAWDVPTRLFHWLLLALIVSAWVSYEYAEDLGDELLVWHRWNGISLLVLLTWRLLWGVFGSSTARFAAFAPLPASVWRHARETVTGAAPRYLGHNPLGSVMILALLVTLIVQAGLGLFAVYDNDLTGGPLHRLVSEANQKTATHRHNFMFHYILLPLAGLHIAANVLYEWLKKEPLIRAMVTGRKPAAAYADAQAAEIAERPLLRAFVCLLAAKLIVFGGILAVGGRF